MFIQYLGFKEHRMISMPGAPNYYTAWGALTSGVAIDKPFAES